MPYPVKQERRPWVLCKEAYEQVVRLAALDCPVYFYTRKDVARIFREANVEIYSITSLGRDYFVVARV